MSVLNGFLYGKGHSAVCRLPFKHKIKLWSCFWIIKWKIYVRRWSEVCAWKEPKIHVFLNQVFFWISIKWPVLFQWIMNICESIGHNFYHKHATRQKHLHKNALKNTEQIYDTTPSKKLHISNSPFFER